MATSAEVLNYLIPSGGWYQVGEDYEGIQFIECASITKKQFTDAFAVVDNLKTQKAADELSKRSAALAKLETLGLTNEDLKALGL
jgi:hypothetical protein